MKFFLRTAAAVFASAWSLAIAQVPAGYPADYDQTVAAAKREGKVVVYSVLSNKAAAPLVRDFTALYPEIKVEYDGEGGSNEIYDRFLAESKGGQGPDVMWSSAMDLQLKLVEDGHAMTYASPEAPRLPQWAVYKHQAYGTTFEPIVFIYNKQQVRGEEIPRDHAGFAKLIAGADKFKGKVTAFDIEKSGVGFMFAVQDRAHNPALDDVLAALGSAEYRASSGSGDMLSKVTSGEYLLGYNIMGAYALVRAKKEPTLGVVMPADYTLVLSRVIFIGKQARHPNAAKLWLDYMLSPRGQKVLADSLELFAIRGDVDAEYTAAKLGRDIGPNARPIPLSAAVTAYLDPAKHARFIDEWKSSIAAGGRAVAAKTAAVDPQLPSYQPQPFAHRPDARYVGADGSIRVIGAEHVEHILKGFNEVFARSHPGTRFTLRLKGTTTAIPTLLHDVSAFGPMGREFNGVELVPYAKIVGQEPLGIRVAHAAHSKRPLATSLAVYVNKGNPLDRLTIEQLSRIFTSGHPRGDIGRWGQAGAEGEWAARQIHVYGTAAHSGFGDFMMKHVFERRPFVRGYEELGNTSAILKRVAEDPAGIGIAAIGRADANVKMVALARSPEEGYSIGTVEDAVSGKYPLARYLLFYVRRVPGKPVDPFVKEYFRLVLSREGQAIIAGETDGYIPLTAKEAAAEWAKLQ